MKNLNHKSIGSLLIASALILLFVLIVVKINTDKEGAFLCKFVETSPTLNMDECPAHESNTSWLLLSAFGISFLVLGAGVYLLFMPIDEKQQIQKKMTIDTSNLSEEETKIYNLLTLHQGSMYQSDIIKQTELTKVKVSRVLDRMDGKGIIDRKRRGMTNMVILK
ncbi:MAG: hypothetical protein Q7K45_00525 [Nanoarchaeota archaeon]|nr:hypothetical protein [Nanoarchaeota archaeon]